MKLYHLKNIFKTGMICLGIVSITLSANAQINTVSVFGSTSHHFPKNFLNSTAQFGKLLAQKNKVMFYEGSQKGLVGNIAETMKANKGIAIIVATPEKYEHDCPEDNACRQLEWVAASNTADQKKELYQMGDAIVILPGGWNTLADFATYTALVQQAQMEKKPVIFLNLNHYWDNLRYQTEEMTRQKVLNNTDTMYVSFVDKPRDVLSEAEKIQKRIEKSAKQSNRKKISLPARNGSVSVHY